MTTKKLSRKQFLMLAGSSVAAGALAACAPQAAPPQAPAAAPKAEPTKAQRQPLPLLRPPRRRLRRAR